MINFYVDANHKYLKQLLASFSLQTNQDVYKIFLVGNTFDDELIQLFSDKIFINKLNNINLNIDEIIKNYKKDLNDNDYIVLVDSNSYLYDLFSVENLAKSISEGPYDIVRSTMYDFNVNSYIYDEESDFLNLFRVGYLKNNSNNQTVNECKTNDVIFYHN